MSNPDGPPRAPRVAGTERRRGEPERRAGRASTAAPEGAAMAAGPVITLLGRPGCHLCEDAREIIRRVAADLGVRWEERDITRSQEDTRRYREQIPVTLINGVQHDFWRVDERRLRAALEALR